MRGAAPATRVRHPQGVTLHQRQSVSTNAQSTPPALENARKIRRDFLSDDGARRVEAQGPILVFGNFGCTNRSHHPLFVVRLRVRDGLGGVCVAPEGRWDVATGEAQRNPWMSNSGSKPPQRGGGPHDRGHSSAPSGRAILNALPSTGSVRRQRTPPVATSLDPYGVITHPPKVPRALRSFPLAARIRHAVT